MLLCMFTACSDAGDNKHHSNDGKAEKEELKQSQTVAKKGKSLTEVLEEGKLVAVTSPDFPPFESIEDGAVVGIEVDIFELVCKELGVELEFAQTDFDTIIPAVKSGKYDCGVAGITVTEEHKQNILFTVPYYNAAQAIVVKEDSEIKGKADLDGKTVSVQEGTTAESGCNDAGLTYSAYMANADAKAALTKGKVDAWVVDNLTAAQMVEEGDGLKILDETFTDEPYAFAFAFGSEDLVEEINKILTKYIEDGTIEEIFAKYGEVYVKP